MSLRHLARDSNCPNGGVYYSCFGGFTGCCLIDACTPGVGCPKDKDLTPNKCKLLVGMNSYVSAIPHIMVQPKLLTKCSSKKDDTVFDSDTYPSHGKFNATLELLNRHSQTRFHALKHIKLIDIYINFRFIIEWYRSIDSVCESIKSIWNTWCPFGRHTAEQSLGNNHRRNPWSNHSYLRRRCCTVLHQEEKADKDLRRTVSVSRRRQRHVKASRR
jgi:hypothetical protein